MRYTDNIVNLPFCWHHCSTLRRQEGGEQIFIADLAAGTERRSKKMKMVVTTLTLACVSLILTGTFTFQSFAVIDPGTVAAMWLFDREGDVAKDSSENGYDGTLVDEPKWTQGKFGKALELDGVDDYVNCGNVLINTESFSVFAWIEGESGDNKWIVSKHDSAKGERSWVIGLEGTGRSTIHATVMETGDAAAYKNYYGSEVVADGSWHHIGFTWNSGEFKVYSDGVEDKSVKKNRDDNFKSLNNYDDVDLLIGNHMYGAGPRANDWFEGTVDEVIIFNVALSPDDVKSLMNGAERSVLAVSPEGKLTEVWGAIKVQ